MDEDEHAGVRWVFPHQEVPQGFSLYIIKDQVFRELVVGRDGDFPTILILTWLDISEVNVFDGHHRCELMG